MKKAKSMVAGWLMMKCPKCRTGSMFINESVFPLKDMMRMPERCHCCGQKMEPEPGFYYGTGYVSYGITVAMLVFNAVWWALFVGFSWDNNSLYWYLGISIGMMVVLQPWIMRISRVMYLAMFVKYDKNHPVLSKEEAEAIPELTQGYMPNEHKPMKQNS